MICEYFVKTTAKLNLNVGGHGWAREKIFHSILLEAALNSIFTFLNSLNLDDYLSKKMTGCPINLV